MYAVEAPLLLSEMAEKQRYALNIIKNFRLAGNENNQLRVFSNRISGTVIFASPQSANTQVNYSLAFLKYSPGKKKSSLKRTFSDKENYSGINTVSIT